MGVVAHKVGASTSPVSRRAYKPLSEQYGAGKPTPGAYAEKPADEAYDGRRQPATGNMTFELANLRRSGNLVAGDVTWEPKTLVGMSGKNIEHAIISFVKMRATHKQTFDLGDVAQVRVRTLDTHAGLAEVVFQSSRRVAPREVVQVDEGVNLG